MRKNLLQLSLLAILCFILQLPPVAGCELQPESQNITANQQSVVTMDYQVNSVTMENGSHHAIEGLIPKFGFYIQVSLSNLHSTVPANLILAGYDKNGKQLDCHVQSINLAVNQTGILEQYFDNADENIASLKIFVVSQDGNSAPLSELVTYTGFLENNWLGHYDKNFYQEILSHYTEGYKSLETALKITTSEQLAALAAFTNDYKDLDFYGKFITLEQDMDISKYQWFPISMPEIYISGDVEFYSSGGFAGTFNGNQHTISGLTVNEPYRSLYGLFGAVNYGTVKNINVDGRINAYWNLGGITSFLWFGEVENCISNVEFVTGGMCTGGIVGQNCTGGIISDCQFNGSICGDNQHSGNIGGIAGWSGSTIKNSTVAADIHGCFRIGGIVGRMRYSGSVYGCTYSGNVTGNQQLGHIVGADDRGENGTHHVDCTKVGTSQVTLSGHTVPGVRTQEMPLGDFTTDAMLWYTREKVGKAADLAIFNGGGLRASLFKGEILMYMLSDIYPFGNTITTLEVSGAELLETLEAATRYVPERCNPFPQCSGITFDLDTTISYQPGAEYSGRRVSHVKIGNCTLEMDRTYTVVTNDYLANGGDEYDVFGKNGKNKCDTGVDMLKVCSEYIQEELGGTITAEQYGHSQERIHITSE